MSPWDYASPLKWATTQSGKTFLMSSKWEAEVQIGSRLYVGNAGMSCANLLIQYHYIFAMFLISKVVQEIKITWTLALKQQKQQQKQQQTRASTAIISENIVPQK